jgi:hypothetical protein
MQCLQKAQESGKELIMMTEASHIDAYSSAT